MHKYANDNGITDIFFCGDLFHTHEIVRTEVLNAAYESFSKMFNDKSLHLYFLVGNHDMANKMGGVHSLPFFEGDNSMVIDEPINLVTGSGMSVSMCPYTEDKELLEKFFSTVQPGSMVFLHQGIGGVAVNSKGFTVKGEILDRDDTPRFAGHVFSGHYHSYKRVHHNLTIPGSMTQLTWNDKGESRGWLDVTVNDGDIFSIARIDSGAPRFVEVTGPTYTEDVEGNFVRVLGDRNLFDEIVKRDKAESVEFVEVFNGNDSKIDSSNEFSSVTDLFEEFLKSRELPSRYEEVGRELVDGTYEADIPDSK